jgi:hypothetical protein
MKLTLLLRPRTRDSAVVPLSRGGRIAIGDRGFSPLGLGLTQAVAWLGLESAGSLSRVPLSEPRHGNTGSQSWRDCPRGVVVSQQKEWGEILTGFETKNRCAISDESGNRLYLAADEEDR